MSTEADVVVFRGYRTRALKAMPKVKDEAELERVARELLKKAEEDKK